jgi:hypothetical protein
MMKKWKLNFGLPSNFELGFVVLAFLFFIVMDASQNIGQNFVSSGTSFTVLTWWGLSAILSWWIFFSLYNIMLFIVFGRALRTRGTSYKYDVIAGIVGFVGLLFILGAGIFAFYGSGDTPIPYLLGLPQITAYHFGIACELLALLYFIVTE